MRPDILTAGKGTTSGYVPFGFAAASGEVFDTVARTGFVHGFTWSHNALGAAAARAVLQVLRDDGLVKHSASAGERLRTSLGAALEDVPAVGDVRGLGLMTGIELVRDAGTKEPFRRADQVTERILAAARDDGLLLYSSTAHVDGADGDLVMLGPPFCLSDEEADLIVERTAAAIRSVVRARASASSATSGWGSTITGPATPCVPARAADLGAARRLRRVRRSRRADAGRRAGPRRPVGTGAHPRLRRRHPARGPW